MRLVSKEEMNQVPHKLIGALTYSSPALSSLLVGSAILIAPNLILTCAHNLYSKQSGELFCNFKFYPGLHGRMSHFYEVEDIFFSLKFHFDCIRMHRGSIAN